MLNHIPALFMRGGTSKAIVVRESDLPANQDERDQIFLALMGSPDPNGRQLDGMGGGLSSLSKVCILAPSSHDDADVFYTFAQVPIAGSKVDYSGNCGNMSSAMGPAAIELGLVPPPRGPEGKVRIFNTNTKKLIVARFPVADGQYDPNGDFAIDGVSGTGGRVRLDFEAPGGTKTGKLLPTGRPRDVLILPDGCEIEASCVDAANPCVFVRARDLGKTGMELPQALESDAKFMSRMEQIRCAASVMMGMTEDASAAGALGAVPKVAMVAEPQDYALLSGESLPADKQSLVVRMLSMGQPHRAIPVTGGICVATAVRVPGTIPSEVATHRPEAIEVAHPSGRLTVDAAVRDGHDARLAFAEFGTVFRTARKLFSGDVWFR